MCRMLLKANPALWDSYSKSVYIDGATVALRIENFYWGVLEEIAERNGISLDQLIRSLYFEATEANLTNGSFTSLLRVCCGWYLDLMARGKIPDDGSPICDLPADCPRGRRTDDRRRLIYSCDKP